MAVEVSSLDFVAAAEEPSFADFTRHAQRLHELAAAHATAGRGVQALGAARAAMAAHQALCAQDPRHRPALAASLDLLVHCLRITGDHTSAQEMAEESGRLHRELAAEAVPLPPETPRNRARAFEALSAVLGEQGQHASAVRAAQAAVDLYRALAAGQPQAHALDLARAQESLADLLRSNGQRAAALEAAHAAVTTLRALSQGFPGLCEPRFADALEALAGRLLYVGQCLRALMFMEECVEVRRRLMQEDPGLQLPGLVASLQKLAARRQERDLPLAARAALTEAAGLCRTLPAHQGMLAGCLLQLAQTARAAGDTGAALEALQEAVACHRALSAQSPGVYGPFLAASTLELAGLLHERAEHTQAQAVSEESILLHETLAALNPACQRALPRARQLRERCRASGA